jgi:hypothetical protein
MAKKELVKKAAIVAMGFVLPKEFRRGWILYRRLGSQGIARSSTPSLPSAVSTPRIGDKSIHGVTPTKDKFLSNGLSSVILKPCPMSPKS